MPGSARAAFPIPAKGFLSVICLPEKMKTANCLSGRSCRSRAPPPPPLPPVTSAPRPHQAPASPGPFHRLGAVRGRGAPEPVSPAAASPHPIKALSAARSRPSISLPDAATSSLPRGNWARRGGSYEPRGSPTRVSDPGVSRLAALSTPRNRAQATEHPRLALTPSSSFSSLI